VIFSSEKPRTPISNIQRQERNIGEINKLKEDIEELAQNLRVYYFFLISFLRM